MKKRVVISFIAPEMLHPSGNSTSISDVALVLEAKYKIVESFSAFVYNRIEEKITSYSLKGSKNWSVRLSEWVKDEWRTYIVEQLHRIQTKKAFEEGRESFIDTGAYYRSLQVQVSVN